MTKTVAIPFTELGVWAPRSYTSPSWPQRDEELTRLGAVLMRRKDKVDKYAGEAEMVSISFDGEFTPRGVDPADIAGTLHLATAGDLVFSKIDVRNGAIGIVPNKFPRIAVTSEFPVYRVGVDADPTYLTLLLRSPKFKAILQSMVRGASGRKRISDTQLENIAVPLGDVKSQKVAIAPWAEARAAYVEAEMEVEAAIRDLDAMLRASTTSGALAVLEGRVIGASMSDLRRWDVAHRKAVTFQQRQAELCFLSELAEESTINVKPAAQPDHKWPVYGVNNRDGVFLRHRQSGRQFNSSYKRIEGGWFFHNPTRSVVGSLGRVPDDVPDDAITSPEYQVWRAKSAVDSNFLEALLRTRYLRELIRLHRSGGVKQRLYVADLLAIGIPPLAVNDRRRLGDRYRLSLAALDSARARLEHVTAQFWASISGTNLNVE